MQNRFEQIIGYLDSQVDNQNAWTLEQLFFAQRLHEQWYQNQYEVDDILEKHGVSSKEWVDVLNKARKWYAAVPPKKFEVINNAIKARIKKKIGYLPAQTLWSYSVFSGQLSSIFRAKKSNKIVRFKGPDGLYRYYYGG
tara:strand:+ start:427 stop:843 length:417 start_codon:yes stop_codon:yes gene_type:complete